jgi:hypothetical protein
MLAIKMCRKKAERSEFMGFKDKPKSENAQSDKKVARSIQMVGVFVDANPLGHLPRIGLAKRKVRRRDAFTNAGGRCTP